LENDMTLSHWKIFHLLALLAYGPASAQLKANAEPARTATLDICHDTATGGWRYSGMAAVAGAVGGMTVTLDPAIQNSSSPAGYVDAMAAPALSESTALPAASGSRMARYSIDAAPLILGTVRNLTRIRISDPLAPTAPPLLLSATADFTAAVCGCQQPRGCTRTQGYWKSKPGVIWPAPYSRAGLFYGTGLSWQQLLDTAPQGGNGYVILAHQYIAALLNGAAGASAPASIQNILSNAAAFFAGGATLASCGGAACATQKTWAGLLDTYNHGLYPGAPGHCPD
jgi:hypothetical protein